MCVVRTYHGEIAPEWTEREAEDGTPDSKVTVEALNKHVAAEVGVHRTGGSQAPRVYMGM